MGVSNSRQPDANGAAEIIETADPLTVRLLPYHFAKAKGVITARQVGADIEVWLAPDPASSTLSEVKRMTGKGLKPVLLSTEEFNARLAHA